MATSMVFFICLAGVSSYFIATQYEIDLLNDEQDIAENIIKTNLYHTGIDNISLNKNSPLIGLKLFDAKGKLIREVGTNTNKGYIDVRFDPPIKNITSSRFLDVAFPIIANNKTHHILARVDIQKTQDRTNVFFKYLKEINTLMLLFFALMILLIIRKIVLSPILTIINSVQAAKDNPGSSCDHKITKLSSDEIGELGREINRLLEINQQHFNLLSSEIEQLKHYDSDTMLPNNIHFIKLLTSKISGTSLWLCNFHLHNINSFQKTLSDIDCNLLHRTIVSRLQSCFKNNELLGRIAEFEYALVCSKYPTPAQLLAAAEALQKTYPGAAITCHIGIAKYPDDTKLANELLSFARLAADKARLTQQVYASFIPEMNIRSIEDQLLLADIETAINESHFHLVYQPQFSLPAKQLTGCEALVRWQHPKHGLIPPDRFIPLLTQAGMMQKFEAWLIAHALSQPIFGIKASINLAASQLNQQTIDQLITACKQQAIDPQNITVEITETELLNDIEISKMLLQQLHSIGFTIAADDFGTGYSPLSYIQMLPIDIIKIDRSFVKDINHNQQNKTIVKHVIDMSHSLGLTVVAEGVETESEFDVLVELQCDTIQGYLLGKPMLLDDYLKIIEEAYAQHLSPSRNVS